MFLDYLYNFPNETQPDNILVQVVSEVNILPPFLLLFIFFTIFLGGIYRQKNRTATADYPMWGVVASLVTLVSTLLLSIPQGIIRLDWLVIVVVVTLFFGIWLFLDRRQSEV